jgi:hypothetical protein
VRLVLLSLGFVFAALPAFADELSPYQSKLLASLEVKVPSKLDQVTTIVGFSFEGDTIVYHYQVAADLSPDVDLAAYRAKQFDGYCATMRSIFKPDEVTALTHDFAFSGGQEVRMGVTMEECQAVADADRQSFFKFAREQSGI